MTGLLLVLVGCSASSTTVPTVRVEDGVFQGALVAAGALEAASAVQVTGPSYSGNIQWMIDEGSIVESGDHLLSLESEGFARKVREATDALEIARTKIEQQRAKVALQLEEQRRNVERARLDLQLAEMQRTDAASVSRVDREASRVRAQKAQLAIEDAERQLVALRQSSAAEIELLQLEVAAKEGELAIAEKGLASAEVKAPAGGLVTYARKWDGQPWRVGERLWSGWSVFDLPDLDRLQVAAAVHEVDSPRVALGQRARITMDALPGVVIDGEVTRVADLAVARGEDGVKYLDVTVSMRDAPDRLRPGLPARIELVVQQLDDVRWVPHEAVFREGDEAFVWVRGWRGWERAPVTLGATSDTHVVLLEGPDVGVEVAMVQPDDVDPVQVPGAQL